MKSVLLAAALLFPARAQDRGQAAQPPPIDPDAVMSQFVAPLKNLAVAAVDDVMDARAASAWALWDLLNDLKKQKSDGSAKPVPSPALVEAWLRLMMRLNTGELTKFSHKPYPSDADFQWAAAEAGKSVTSYAASVKPQDDLLAKRHRGRVESVMSKALNRMITFRLRGSLHGELVVPPFAPGAESAYINKARMNKQGNVFSFPPWPDR